MLSFSSRYLALLSLLTSSASATTFEFLPERSDLVPVLWNYREVSTRKFIGCRQWDVLQGTGWFQAGFYTDYTPVLKDGIYSVILKQKLPAQICAAKMDAYNSIRLEMGELSGSFSIVPDGVSSEAVITCRPNPDGTPYSTIQCDEPHVAVPEQGTVRITIRYQE